MAPTRRDEPKTSSFLRLIAGIGAIALVTASFAAMALGAGTTTNAVANRQALKASAETETTTSMDFSAVQSLSGLTLTNRRGAVTATVSMNLSGAPVDVRIRMGATGKVLSPASAHFEPAAGGESFSYTFVAKSLPQCATLNVEWRSPTGQPVTIDGGSSTALFNKLQKGAACI